MGGFNLMMKIKVTIFKSKDPNHGPWQQKIPLKHLTSLNPFLQLAQKSVSNQIDNIGDDLRYSPLKEIQLKVLEEKKKDDEDIESSDSDCKYSVFSSLRKSHAKGVYTGWSNQVLGESKEMGWSEILRGKL